MTSPKSEPVDDFHSAATRRIRVLVVVLGFAGTTLLLPLRGWQWSLGFALGVVAAYVNLTFLEQAAAAVAARASGQGSRSGWIVAVGHLARFTMVAVAAYVIFEFSKVMLYGFVCGLFVPVGAMFCEAAYEAWHALWRS